MTDLFDELQQRIEVMDSVKDNHLLTHTSHMLLLESINDTRMNNIEKMEVISYFVFFVALY